MGTIIPGKPPTRRWHPTWEDYNTDSTTNDSLMSDLEVRIIALEEAVAYRCARRRLARSIRQSYRAYSWAGSFFAARLESTTHDWLNGPRWLVEARKAKQRLTGRARKKALGLNVTNRHDPLAPTTTAGSVIVCLLHNVL